MTDIEINVKYLVNYFWKNRTYYYSKIPLRNSSNFTEKLNLNTFQHVTLNFLF